MRNCYNKIFFILLLGALSVALSSAQAGPLDFFRKIRDSIVHGRHHQRSPPRTQSEASKTTVKRNDVRPPELKEPEPTESPSTVATQDASRVAAAQRPRTDFPYAVPVPTKPGFVIS